MLLRINRKRTLRCYTNFLTRIKSFALLRVKFRAKYLVQENAVNFFNGLHHYNRKNMLLSNELTKFLNILFRNLKTIIIEDSTDCTGIATGKYYKVLIMKTQEVDRDSEE